MIDLDKIALELSRPISIDDVPSLGRHWTVTATPQECQALAQRYGIPAVERLEAVMKVRAMPRSDKYKVVGTLSAAVVQVCVVSLGPVRQTIDESFSVIFGPQTEDNDDPEAAMDLNADDPPDPLIDGMIDLGEVAAEHLALALDPFPRAEGAQIQAFAPDIAPEETVTNRPFAVLSEFRNKKLQK